MYVPHLSPITGAKQDVQVARTEQTKPEKKLRDRSTDWPQPQKRKRAIEQLLSWNKDKCRRIATDFDRTSYDDLMDTTFALIPSGRSPATYRLVEALSAGALPVFIHQVR